MILQPAHGGLTASNCAFILMDYQAQFASTVSSMSGETLINNAVNVAKVAMTFSIPTVLTTVSATRFGGPLLPKLQEAFPGLKPIDRIFINPWEDSRALSEIEKAGRTKLVVAGLWTDFGVSIFVLEALRVGYEVYIVVDACGDMSARAHRTAMEHMLQEGAVPMTWLQLLLTLHREWASPDTFEVLLHAAQVHARSHGLDLQYTQILPDEGQTKFVNDKAKEGRWGKWSIVPNRLLRTSQKRL
jgi:nicotinamidase-related amidase